MKLHFITCGEPDDRFCSQVAIQRIALDALGGIYRSARLTIMMGCKQPEIPPRWRPHLSNIQVLWNVGYLDALDDEAQATIICDADTLLIRPLPSDFLQSILDHPAFCGVIAHHPPIKTDDAGHDYTDLSDLDFWQRLAQHAIDMPLQIQYPFRGWI